MPADTHYDLFISYADADHAWVEGCLLAALEQAGLRCHIEAAFTLGAPRVMEFERAVLQSERTLLVLSPAYLQGDVNQFISVLAQSLGLDTGTERIIPLILKPVKLPPRLAMLVSIDATESADCSGLIERLCDAIKRPPPSWPSPLLCPYPGMVPFGETDSGRFYGRGRETRELLELLRLHPFLAVIGPSGAGKSSLVFAGLVPALRKTTLFDAGEWLVLSLRPGEKPLAALATEFGSDLSDPARAVNEKLSAQPNAHRLLMVIDQFEELFTTTQGDSGAFQERLLQLSRVPNCYVILTIRSDFYSDLFESPLWSEIRANRFEVLRLKDDGLRDAIVRPAEAVDVFIEDALAERLVMDANISKEQGVLPLVQETLVLLWDRLERRFLPLHAYAELGDGQRTGLEVAIARRADQALANLPTEQHRAIARRIFLRLLQFGEGRADTRRQQPASALRAAGDDPQAFNETLRRLAESRLLTLSGEEGQQDKKVDIAHEALIAGWPELQGWLKQRKEAEQTRRRLEDKAAEWVRLGRGQGGLLDEAELAEAQGWLEGPEAAGLGYSQALQNLVQSSQVAAEAAGHARQQQHIVRAALIGLSTLVGVVVLTVVTMLALGIGLFPRAGEWVQGEGLRGFVRVLARDPQDAQVLYAGTDKQGVFKSVDGGRQWVNVLPITSSVQSLVVLSNGAFYVGSTKGRVWQKDSASSKWRVASQILDVDAVDGLIIDPIQPQTLYASSAGTPYLYRSLDDGARWTQIELPGTQGGVSTIAAARSLATTILYVAMNDGQIYRSLDHGESWEGGILPRPLPSMVQLIVSPSDPNQLYAVSLLTGVARVQWSQQGFVWEWLLQDPYAWNLTIDHASPTIMYTAGANRVKMIQNNGGPVHSHPIADNLPGISMIRTVLFGGVDTPYYLYAATDNGVFGWLPSLQERMWLDGQ